MPPATSVRSLDLRSPAAVPPDEHAPLVIGSDVCLVSLVCVCVCIWWLAEEVGSVHTIGHVARVFKYSGGPESRYWRNAASQRVSTTYIHWSRGEKTFGDPSPGVPSSTSEISGVISVEC